MSGLSTHVLNTSTGRPAAGLRVTLEERTVDVHISHLRKKIGDEPRAPKRIRTVRGVGYVFVREGE